MAEVSTSTPCPRCGAGVYDDAAFCHACGAPQVHSGDQSRAELVREFTAGALRQAEQGARAVLGNPTAQKVAGGAVLGAGLAVFIPFVTMAAGATAGAAYIGYKLLTKD